MFEANVRRRLGAVGTPDSVLAAPGDEAVVIALAPRQHLIRAFSIQLFKAGYSTSCQEKWRCTAKFASNSRKLSGLRPRTCACYVPLIQRFRCCNKGPITVRYPLGRYEPTRYMVGLRKVLGVVHVVTLVTLWLVGGTLLVGLCALESYLLWGLL